MSRIEQIKDFQRPRHGQTQNPEPRHNYEEITRNINVNRKCAEVFKKQVERHLRGDSSHGIDIMIRDNRTEISYTPFPEDKIGRYCTPLFLGMGEGDFKK